MTLTLNNEKIKRYKDIFLLILKHINEPIFRYNNDKIEEEIKTKSKPADEVKKDAEQLAAELEEMGPTFIKLGQLLSTRADLLSPEYIKALTKLQDNIKPFSFQEVEKIVLHDLGTKINKAFTDFDPEPVAAASLAQVHRAKLRNGKEVAVKVQRPGIRKIIQNDLDTLEELASVIDKYTTVGKQYLFEDILKQFRKTLYLELDYMKEAQNMEKIGEILTEYKNIIIPQPVYDYSAERILTMDFIHGTNLNLLSPVVKLEINTVELAEDLMKGYLDQVLVLGFFHADPHPGNIIITHDKKIGLIDLGMTSRISGSIKDNLLKLLLNISDGNIEETTRFGINLGVPQDNFDEETYKRKTASFISNYLDSSVEDIEVGKVIIEISRIASQNGLRPLPELTMLGKTLLNLDAIVKILHPEINPAQIIKEHSQNIMQKHMMKNFSPGNIFSSLLEVNEILKKLPRRINKFFYLLSNNKLRIKVDTIDEFRLTRDFQKIANRITLGAILASLIIGAAILMNIKTEFEIFGYPGFAMILFLFAAGCGIALAVNIFLYDEWKRGKNKNS